MEKAGLELAVLDLLCEAGIDSSGAEVVRVEGGGNNKVFAANTKDATYLAKIYYSNPSDTRNRLGAEYSFLSYACEIGLNCVPRPLYCSPGKNMGLYEFVEGRKLAPAELTSQHVIEAANFIRLLNAGPDRGRNLPVASEGCFSIAQHFSLIDRRINRLCDLPTVADIDHQARSFVDTVARAWEKLKAGIEVGDAALSRQLDDEDRCISPSDFGFHNALLKNTGNICFIDFEYAGWDDPAKMIGDFFSQPTVPVALDHFDSFLTEALSYSKNKAALEVRARLLLPAFQIKWCCIMLNEFLPDAAGRRRFANPGREPTRAKQMQLEKAQQFFNSRVGQAWLT